jgi:hypothetical protein
MSRTSSIQSPVKLTIGDKEHTLLFDFQAIKEAEDISGVSILAGLSRRDVNAPRISLIQAMLYAGLMYQDPKLTFEKASQLVTLHNWQEIWNKILLAWVACMEPAKPEDGKANPPIA